VLRLVLAGTVALVLAGCGGGPSVSGRAVFGRACSQCHTLTGHDVNIDGGDLAVGHLSRAQVESFTTIMPVHLTPAEIHAVAGYVVSREQRAPR